MLDVDCLSPNPELHFAEPAAQVSLFSIARLWRAFLIVNVVAIMACAIGYRVWDLGRLPGINGDEAWYGVQTEMLLAGESITWKTPTDNWLNPFFLGPMVLVHLISEPSFTALRLPALISGIMALMLNYWLARRACGSTVSIVSTLILAVLPINIAYCRFAWDASQSLLFTLPVIYGPLLAIVEPAQRLRWSRLAFGFALLAIVVHPTNIFAVPWLLILQAYAWRERLAVLLSTPGRRWIAVGLVISLGLLLLGPRLMPAMHRATDPRQMCQFAVDFVQLFSGVTVFEYISGGLLNTDGSLDPRSVTRIVFDTNSWVIIGLIGWFIYRRIVRRRVPLEMVLCCAWLACVLSFYLIAGPAAIAPHYERYAICLIAPTVLIASRAFAWWMQPSTRFSHATAPLLLAAAWSMLFAFQLEYFNEFHLTGGQSHRTFRTGVVEPKQAALELAMQLHSENNSSRGKSASDEPLLIVTSEWWLYWPLRYLASRAPNVNVELQSNEGAIASSAPPLDAVVTRIEFASSAAAWRIEQTIAQRRRAGESPRIAKQTVRDAGGRPLIAVFINEEDSPQRRGDTENEWENWSGVWGMKADWD